VRVSEQLAQLCDALCYIYLYVEPAMTILELSPADVGRACGPGSLRACMAEASVWRVRE
jgi:hypothetical protein